MKFIASDDKRMAKVNKARDRIQEIDSELSVLESAPIPREDVEQRIDAWLEKTRSDKGLMFPLASGFVRPDGHGIPSVSEWRFGGPNDPPFNFLSELLRIQALMQPGSIKAGLMYLVDQYLEAHEPGPPLADRPAQRRKLEVEREQFELLEESEIEKLERDGWLVHRRADARPEIILGEVTA